MSRFVPVRRLSVAVVLFALAGCGGGSPGGKSEAPPAVKEQAAGGAKNEGAADPAAVNAVPPAPMIIYTATLDVIVKDLDTSTAEAEKLVAAHKGFVAKSEVKGDTGSRRTAVYTVRVPVGGFGALKDGLLALGTAERNVVDTQDVTEEFVDVEARIKNLQDQESKLNELLKEKRKEEKLEDVIKVSDRVFLVRGDIERAQGRRNYLKNRVQLSTVNVTLREVKDYKPPTAPMFGSRAREAFENSWDGLVGFGSGVALFAVRLAPWAPVWLPALIAGVWAVRRGRRLAREAAEQVERERPRRSRVTAEEAVAEVRAEGRAEPVKPPEGPKPPG